MAGRGGGGKVCNPVPWTGFPHVKFLTGLKRGGFLNTTIIHRKHLRFQDKTLEYPG